MVFKTRAVSYTRIQVGRSICRLKIFVSLESKYRPIHIWNRRDSNRYQVKALNRRAILSAQLDRHPVKMDSPVNRLVTRFPYLLDKFVRVHAVYYDFKLICHMFLQAQYELLVLQTRPNKMAGELVSAIGLSGTISSNLTDHRLLMRRFGMVCRDMGPFAMFNYAATLFVHLIFVFGNDLTGGLIERRYNEDSFVFAYRWPSKSDQELVARFDRYLGKLIYMNERKRLDILCNTFSQKSWHQYKRTQQIVNDLNEHELRLRKLVADKTAVWPLVHRGLHWREKQRKFLTQFYCLLLLFGYSSTLLLIFILVHLSNEKIEALQEKPMNLMEKLTLIEVYLLLLSDKLILPIVILLLSLVDKIVYLQTLRMRFKHLKSVLQFMRTGCVEVRIESPRWRSQSLECDQEAMEIYLSLRVFMDQLKSTTSLASLLADLGSLMALAMLALTLPFYNHNEGSRLQLFVLLAIAIDLGILLNLSLIVCAIFESEFTKTIQQAWSLVAHMTVEICPTQTNFENEQKPMGGANQKPNTRHRQIAPDVSRKQLLSSVSSKKIEKDDLFAYAESRDSLLNEQIALLWRRFIKDIPTLKSKFQCRIFGSQPLDYSGLLKLNFWYISVVLVFLSHKSAY